MQQIAASKDFAFGLSSRAFLRSEKDSSRGTHSPQVNSPEESVEFNRKEIWKVIVVNVLENLIRSQQASTEGALRAQFRTFLKRIAVIDITA